jgi:DNA-directed RNA polymerase subunit RPC12/RpoP
MIPHTPDPEVVHCDRCKRAFTADHSDLATYTCPHCNKSHMLLSPKERQRLQDLIKVFKAANAKWTRPRRKK